MSRSMLADSATATVARAVGDHVTACLPGTAWSAVMPNALPVHRVRNAPCQRVNALSKVRPFARGLRHTSSATLRCARLNIFGVGSLFDLRRSHSFAGYLP
ncbi:hypothetical protein XACLE3_3530002 [Xanthomonas citri pv. citri]|nr:hypothetical protein XACLE3_3530002 [Xanthomonas citri pv. citri]CEH50422.1 hypothetical protein XACG102_4290002 [Xanthomonas citri pv. citri]CEH63156.1 hypothetical protein XAC3615_5530002 [Xanthomonas citri pv. citri]CEH72348.1 hypothetical protein XACS582_5570002 [Xanthomonas citri pv. citri]CEJ23317.1 hypothetical protein XACE116_4870002 [Xanthomonas citri pv. citri]